MARNSNALSSYVLDSVNPPENRSFLFKPYVADSP
jgi:hypothetical protein